MTKIRLFHLKGVRKVLKYELNACCFSLDLIFDMEIDAGKESFASQALDEGLRLDHRALHQYRPFRILFGAEYGKNVVTHLGKTYVSTSVSYDLVEPSLSSPSTGFFDIVVAFKPNITQQGITQKSINVTNAIRFALEQCLKGSGIVDVNSFVHIPGKVVGSLRLDITILNDDGNLIDCCAAAAQAALRHFRFHEVTCDESNRIQIHRERDPIPFVTRPIPLVVTVGVYKERIIIDPNTIECAFIDALVNICISPNGSVTAVYKHGGKPLCTDILMECSNVAVAKGLKWLAFISGMLEKDLDERKAQFRSNLDNIKKAYSQKSV